MTTINELKYWHETNDNKCIVSLKKPVDIKLHYKDGFLQSLDIGVDIEGIPYELGEPFTCDIFGYLVDNEEQTYFIACDIEIYSYTKQAEEIYF